MKQVLQKSIFYYDNVSQRIKKCVKIFKKIGMLNSLNFEA